MYALLCLGFITFVWMGFIYRMLVNVQRENEIKRNTQQYYKKKILKLKSEIYEREQRGFGGKKSKGG